MKQTARKHHHAQPTFFVFAERTASLAHTFFRSAGVHVWKCEFDCENFIGVYMCLLKHSYWDNEIVIFPMREHVGVVVQLFLRQCRKSCHCIHAGKLLLHSLSWVLEVWFGLSEQLHSGLFFQARVQVWGPLVKGQLEHDVLSNLVINLGIVLCGYLIKNQPEWVTASHRNLCLRNQTNEIYLLLALDLMNTTHSMKHIGEIQEILLISQMCVLYYYGGDTNNSTCDPFAQVRRYVDYVDCKDIYVSSSFPGGIQSVLRDQHCNHLQEPDRHDTIHNDLQKAYTGNSYPALLYDNGDNDDVFFCEGSP